MLALVRQPRLMRRLYNAVPPTLQNFRALSLASSEEFVAAAERARSTALSSAFTLPPEIRDSLPGGVLLYESGEASSKRLMSVISAGGTIVTTTAAMAVLAAYDLSAFPEWFIMISSLTGLAMSIFTIGSVRSAIRYIALDPGGEHIWLYLLTFRSASGISSVSALLSTAA